MIEAIQIPILLKAIDFLFDEGRKIMEERRERRKAQEAPPISGHPEPAMASAPVEQKAVKGEEVQNEETDKQELLTSNVDELTWRDNEQEVQHLVRLLETYSRNYHLAKEQYAKWGSALVPPIILHNLTEAEDAMAETVKRLEGALSKVYKKDIHLDQ